MSTLPVPAKIYFNDFSFDLVEYTVKRNSSIVGSYKGLSNKDVLMCETKNYIVKAIDYDTYNGQPELIKAYF